MDFEFWRRHPGRLHGILGGLLFGLLATVLGFWQAIFVFFCAGVGYALAWYLEQYGGFYGFLAHLLRRR
ncbi:MAG: DUF2273 domain-containing protein [Clostridia bacterium]|nr:DUF2273 domain-containing protein [Clostridia bacterium]